MRISQSPSLLAVLASILLCALLLSPGAGATGVLASPADDSVQRVLEDHLRRMQLQAGQLRGPGAEFLLEEASSAEVLSLGEAHNTVEIPELVTAMLPQLRQRGYGAYAVETGPGTAAHMEALAAGEAPVEALTAWNATYPFTVPFFDRAPEARMAVAAVGAGFELWGIDQEFVGSGRWWLDRLAELAPDAEAAELVGDWIAGEREAYDHFRETGETDGAFFHVVTPEEIRAARDAFEEVPAALEILDELAASARIYQLFGAGENYRSNQLRIDRMKSNLATRIDEPGGPEPTGGAKLLVKLGSMHAGRGYSALNQLDVGNFVAELATLRGGRSFHVQLLGVRFVPEEGDPISVRDRAPHLAPILDLASPDEWTVLDLRPLRPVFHSGAPEGHEGLADTVWAYDAVVVAPELTASRLLARP